ncbi:MAG: gliding motility-associated C-terminal domain-containing protein [Prevotellaceae bacterium]|nr:gliding motility-associated C-terminal domain-containing protein [Prevotellaceae bacterium]
MKKLKYIPLMLAFLLNGIASAQIVNPAGVDYASLTYNPNGDSTFMFAYFSSNSVERTLKAKSMDGNPAGFIWYRFNSNTQTIDPTPIRTDTGAYKTIESEITGVADGYMVVIETDEVIDTFRAWVFMDVINIDSVSYIQNCEYLQLTAHASSNRNNFSAYDYFDFCDLENVFPRYINNTYTVEWDSDTDIYDGLTNTPQSWKKRTNSFFTRITSSNESSTDIPGPSAPFKDAKYSVKIKNVFGNTTDEYTTNTIPAMGLYAAFDVLVPDDFGIFAPTTNLKGEALWRMKLDNKSINANKFEWLGWNDQTINFLQNDTLWRYFTENIPDEIDYKPGKYPVKLIVENTQTGCRHSSYSLDSEGKRQDIDVAKSIFIPGSLPNAFTPNGDGNNDIFTFVTGQKPVSMRIMDLKIVTRNGTLVYKYKGEVADWEGWNGKMNGNGSECSSGVYYYIISGVGWDDKSYSGKSYTGVLHLFKGN